MEDLVSEAEKKGMYVVDSSNHGALLEEYRECMSEVDRLCDVIDPESTPYQSKYKAREMIDKVCNKLEATRTIAQLEKQRETIDLMNSCLASARIRTGTISWECEEPHNAETDLNLAVDFYFPDIAGKINEMAGNDPSTPVELEPPAVDHLSDRKFGVDALKCLNMLGILWSGRGYLTKSLLYLKAAKNLYTSLVTATAATAPGGNDAVNAKELDSTYTHNLFYLAQVYAHFGDVTKSSYYCRETLQRQLNAGTLTSDIKAAFDWTKNSTGLADFYMAMGAYRHCALTLASAEKVLKDFVIEKAKVSSSSVTTVDSSDVAELEADLHRRWARLDSQLLKIAYNTQVARKNAEESGVPFEEPEAESLAEEEANYGAIRVLTEGIQDLRISSAANATPAAPTAPQGSFSSATNSATPPRPPTAGAAAATTSKTGKPYAELFTGLAVFEPSYLQPEIIRDFDAARVVFIRAAAHIEAAKKTLVLDGFVSDHVSILQEHSRLYHYLTAFEGDVKRKLAMETRRIELLQHLLGSLNKVAFEGLHKQISYEMGEVYISLLEIKLDKLRGRAGGVLDERLVKKAELAKCNSYCKGALAMFAHFTRMYAPTSEAQRSASAGGNNAVPDDFKVLEFEGMSLQELCDAACIIPDEGKISDDEVRSFLNAHFTCCRATSKWMVPPDTPNHKRADALVETMKRYKWLSKYTEELCQKKSVKIEEVFEEELKICKDMAELLPAKIDRMHYH